ncbi:phosphoglucosamine mutase [Shewanella sp. 1_MG-2023]|uniref:phosphoglucosamine mutase n=1 Tax=unclassified Shewanella TaxID=196818 RepID=UPI000C864F91|nr:MULTISPECIES: phosphoglucosamine mutase [unclassified Shewanella]MDO6610129.1 phosphoglucosamine mutase [Shewanella sp. 7_MG-2023]MDO6769729.1 phosphoglucosamine mutase [Shewanella sp. 2_MG-2023]MDO6792793.1 phosphoglucosamine mutase [Shewanella sp. 1_MG-2023]PMG74834.1 phosphoglucosamine mutase [Shewanella sp. 10N.286.51.B7]
MSRKYFGTDGVRGKVGEFPINPSFAMKLGWAAGTVLASAGTKEVIIGKDTRISGYMLETAMQAGFSAAGINCALVGPMPTPAIAYLTSTFRADAGVVISASHNPYYDNGIKLFSNSGTKLNDAQELEIEHLLDQAINHGAMTCVDSAKLGKVRRISDAAGRYIEFCKGTFDKNKSLMGLKIVVDSANGAAYHIAKEVYAELGAEVISINDKPDGLNINERCGATHLDSLQTAVMVHEADLGIALDGDADRVLFVDHNGHAVDGDEILFILAQAAKTSGELSGGVVGTLMSNLGLELALKEMDIPFVRAKVGDRYVVEQLKNTGWLLGGEGSGHILSLKHTTTGDGIVASLQVLNALIDSGKNLSEVKSGMTKLPQILINVRLKADNADEIIASEQVQAAVKAAEVVMGDNGRVLLRKSGTEPLIRVMVESTCEDMTQTQAQSIADAVSAAN